MNSPRHPAPEHIECERIVEMLCHLYLFGEIGHSAGHIHQDTSSKARETLICHKANLTKAFPHLTAAQRQAIILVGLHGLEETEAAETLGVTQSAISRLLWRAAKTIHKLWSQPNLLDAKNSTSSGKRASGNPRSATGCAATSREPSARSIRNGRKSRSARKRM